MKSANILAMMVFSVWTVVTPVLAQAAESTTAVTTTKIDEVAPERLSDRPMRINPQLGVSSFEYDGKSGSSNMGQGLSGGALFEFGEGVRALETGILVFQTQAETTLRGNTSPTEVRSTYLGLPVMAKIRLVNMPRQAWYTKFGFLTAYEMSSNNDEATKNIDTMAVIGGGARFDFQRNSDFIVEATYNRGLFDALRTSGNSYNSGFLILAGISFRL